jgi:Zn-dependent peptidase ImmA (M78 family)
MARTRLTRDGERAVRALIERYDLHRAATSLPVPILQIARNEGWIVAYAERMAPLYGYAIVVGGRWFMRINSAVTLRYQRMAVAHEMAHVLNGDLDHLHLCTATPFESWIDRKQEHRAQLAAARILIPRWVMRESESVAEIATRCEVPTELVELRVHS